MSDLEKLSKDIVVEISFLLNIDGGKTKTILSGYRTQFFYNNHDWDSIHNYINTDRVNPGDKVKAYITFMTPYEHLGKLSEGDHFLVREGKKIVAYGHVIEILELEKHSNECNKC